MTPGDDRDAQLDAILRRQWPTGRPAGACPDAETLAAWSDDGLDGKARMAVETHLADCARCQAVIATVVQGEPAPPVSPAVDADVVPSWRRLLQPTWAVPAMAAAAMLVWALVPREQLARAPQAPPPAVMKEAVDNPPGAAPEAERQSAAPQAARKDEASPALERDNRTAAPAAATTPSVTPQPPAEAEPPAATPPFPVRPEPTLPASAPAPLPDAPLPDAPLPARSAAAMAADAVPPEKAPAQAAPTTAAGAEANMAATARANAKAITGSLVVRASDGRAAWRVAGVGVVERSGDGGTSWQAQALGHAVMPSAGAAPSADVCWLVGPAGTVLLSTDGRTWRALAAPLSADLVAVDAQDAGRATVRSAGGRTFRTTDGGATWSEIR